MSKVVCSKMMWRYSTQFPHWKLSLFSWKPQGLCLNSLVSLGPQCILVKWMGSYRFYSHHAWSPEVWSVDRTAASSAQNCWGILSPPSSVLWCNLSSFLQTHSGIWGHPLELCWRKHVNSQHVENNFRILFMKDLEHCEARRLKLERLINSQLVALMNKYGRYPKGNSYIDT